MSIIRRRGFWISLVASLMLLGAGLASVTPAKAATEVKISLSSSPGWCINVENHDNVVNQPVWLWNCSSGEDLEWIEDPNEQGCIDGGDQNGCFAFEDAQNTSLCLGAPVGQLGDLQLLSCGTPRALWYNNVSAGSAGPGNLESGSYGSSHTVAADGTLKPLQNGSDVVAVGYPPTSGYWWTWSW
jgi:hypothetical protein